LSRGLDSSAIDQWRRYEPQLQPIMAALEPWVKHFGY